MLKLAVDENFNYSVVQELRRLRPALDMVRAQDAGMTGAPDPAILAWAARENRVLLTHDVSTITKHAYDRVRRGEPMPGVVEVAQSVSLGQAIEDILLMCECSLEGEWDARVCYLPLR